MHRLIAILSKSYDIPPNIVRGSFIRGYFNENEFLDPEVAGELHDILGKELFDKLQAAETREDVATLIEQLERKIKK